MKNTLIKIILLFLFSCTTNENITPIKEVKEIKEDSKIIQDVIILGNSITYHPKWESIGWRGDWGMAASSQDKDYVHILIDSLKGINPLVNVEFYNIAEFERDFYKFDLSTIDSIKRVNTDLLIVNLGENVSEENASKYNFTLYLDKLINHISKDSEKILVNSFFPKDIVNAQIKNLTDSLDYGLINVEPLYYDNSNKALNQFVNKSVGKHPSDKGMKEIANLIFNSIK